MSELDDWRARDQEVWEGVHLRWARWWPYRPGWDHDHCEFCWQKLGDEGLAEHSSEPVDTAGYVTDDDYHWFCATCVDDFRERFAWVLDDDDRHRAGTR